MSTVRIPASLADADPLQYVSAAFPARTQARTAPRFTPNSRLMTVAIVGIGHYVPPDILSNDELERRVDTSDKWIREHTGIVTRHVASGGATSDLAVPAIVECLKHSSYGLADVDCLVIATSTPDYAFPSTAAVTLRKLGAEGVWGFDISAACSGFLYALSVATSMIQSGLCRRIIVCGAEKLTSITDYSERLGAVLFGDAAAAVLLETSPDSATGIIDSECRLQPVTETWLYQRAGGSAHPSTAETVAQRQHFLTLNGREVFRAAVTSMADVSAAIMHRNGLSADAIDWFVPHQANIRIIREVATCLGLPIERVMMNIERFGNTSAASIPLCLSEWYERGLLQPGNRVILSSFGAGFTSAGTYLRWSLPAQSRTNVGSSGLPAT